MKNLLDLIEEMGWIYTGLSLGFGLFLITMFLVGVVLQPLNLLIGALMIISSSIIQMIVRIHQTMQGRTPLLFRLTRKHIAEDARQRERAYWIAKLNDLTHPKK